MNYLDMIDKVLARCKGCPEETAVDAMRNACMEFCAETYVLTMGDQITVDGTEVPLTSLAYQVIDVIEAQIAGEPVLVTFLNDPDIADLDDDQYALQFTEPNNAVLTPAPTVAAPVVLDLLIVASPGPTSTEVPDHLWQRYSEALRHGALAKLMEEPGKPWSNPELASFHMAKFADAKNKAAGQAGRNRMTRGRALRVKHVY